MKEIPKQSVIRHSDAKRHSLYERPENRNTEAYENFKRPAYEVANKEINRKE